MKYFILLIALILGFNSNAQESIEKKLGEFDTVKVFDLIHVKMVASDENKVIISGENTKNVEVVNNNGTLKIRMSLKEIFDGNHTTVTLYYVNVDVIDANEGANITVNETIKQYEIDLSVQEGGEITADLETTYANFKAVTGGSIHVTGSSKNQDISIYTGGVFNGRDFITEKAEVSINAAGEAKVNATETVIAKVKAGGTIYIYGNPEQIDESTILGGKIKRM
ncbi:head GIN domain-containing protein [Winogradskyella forsetii]|uniref:head GIN domain-containing protein n=1 Tax=Winogradskyella forsetii TaxID=2686077 RepID=UPI0015C19374|nr:head GIN domain-containing protein [Winogradskyella forsetii]